MKSVSWSVLGLIPGPNQGHCPPPYSPLPLLPTLGTICLALQMPLGPMLALAHHIHYSVIVYLRTFYINTQAVKNGNTTTLVTCELRSSLPAPQFLVLSAQFCRQWKRGGKNKQKTRGISAALDYRVLVFIPGVQFHRIYKTRPRVHQTA